MPRRSWVQRYDPDRGWYLEERGESTPRPVSAAVYGDIPDYTSPITGELVSGRVARREDLKKHGCRPYEKGEREEARKRSQENDRKVDAAIVERLRWMGA